MAQARRQRALRQAVIGLVIVAVLATDLALAPAVPAQPATQKARPARELQALESERPAMVVPEVPDADFTNAPGRVPPPDAGPPPAGAEQAGTSFDEQRSKIVERRERADIFENPDGTRTARLYSQPVNFQDASGTIRPIDTTVVADGDQLRNAAGPLDLRFAARADEANLVSIGVDGHRATLALEEAGASPAQVSGPEVRYPEVSPGVDLEYHVGPTTVKELLVLKRPPAPGEAASFRFPLQLDGLEPAPQPDGSIALVDPEGMEAMRIPAATAWDSAVDPLSAEPTYGPASLELTNEAGSWVLTLGTDPAWLADPARQYPVYLDPTFAAGRQSWSQDTFVTDRYPDTNYDVVWNSTLNRYEDKVGYYDGTTGTNWTYFQYDMGAIDGADILSARWHGYFIWSYFSTQRTRYRLHPAHCGWSAGSMTWNNKPALLAEFVDGDGVRNSWSSSDITGWVRNWTSTVWGDPCMQIDTAGEGKESWKKLAASENGDGTASYIEVNYNLPPAMAQASSAKPTEAAVVSSATPTLSVAPVSDPDGNAVRYWFRVATGGDGETGAIVNSGWISNPTWTVPAATLKDGVPYTWHVYTNDTRLTTSPDWVRGFKVDLRLGERGPEPADGIGPVAVNLSNGNVVVATGSPALPTVGGSVGLSYTYNSQAPSTAGLTGAYYRDANANRAFDADERPTIVRADPRVDF
jgi:hypothetical protein